MASLFINTVILTIGELITKLLGLVIRILTIRVVGENNIELLMLVMPTFTLFMVLSSMGLPVAISKLVATDQYNNKKLVLSIVPVTMILNMIWILIIFLIAPVLATNLLKNTNTYYPILSISLVLPFISISSILRGYYFGKQKMMPHVISLIIEQISRILMLLLLGLFINNLTNVSVVTIVIASSAISELVSIMVLMFNLRTKQIRLKDFKMKRKYVSDTFQTGAYATLSRLIGSLSYFLEPIILMSILTSVGFTSNYVIKEYGIISAYVLPLLLIPSFFTLSLSSAVIPVISKAYINKNYVYLKKKIKQVIMASLILGIITTIILVLFTNPLLNILFNTSSGIKYIKVLAPWFILYYIQVPITAVLQGMDEAKKAMKSTAWGAVFKTITILLLAYVGFGINALIVANVVNLLVVTLDNSLVLYKKLKITG